MSPREGRMTWAEAISGPLAGATCLWQDLDGLHVSAAPGSPPPTSILWGWRPDSWLVRARLDGSTVLVAVHDGGGAVRTVPWSPGEEDGRIAANRGRGPSREDGGAGAIYEQVVIDGIDEGCGPVTFIRPASP
jgi:hypothetical protein